MTGLWDITGPGDARADLEAGLSPEAMIPGNVGAIRDAAREAGAVAAVLIDVAKAISYIEVDWTGEAATRFQNLIDYQPSEFKTAASHFDDAEQALHDYANAIVDARGQAAAAKRQYEQGKAAKKAAQQAATTGALTAPGPGPDDFGILGAVNTLVEARHSVETAASKSASTLHTAAQAAPRAPSPTPPDGNPWWKDGIHFVTHGWQVPSGWKSDDGLKGLGAGLLQSGFDVGNSLNPLGGLGSATDALTDYRTSPVDESGRYQAGYWAFVVGTAAIGGGAGAERGGTTALSRLISKVFKRPAPVDAVETLASRARGWRVGDPIDNLTAAGNEPSWSAVRSRYWKNVADAAEPGEYRPSDLKLMADGRPPRHPQIDVGMELDHIVPRHQGGGHAPANLREVWPWEHAALDPHRYYTGPVPDGFDPQELLKMWSER
ncbi:HNH endonuclease [Nocardioides sp. KR10-350]|uniref:HNH endonuclease signature motif containing protein n=1 Tax=Nocardioides cheoyonin TaxID=3156615 RepID=UPI0032B4FF0C